MHLTMIRSRTNEFLLYSVKLNQLQEIVHFVYNKSHIYCFAQLMCTIEPFKDKRHPRLISIPTIHTSPLLKCLTSRNYCGMQ